MHRNVYLIELRQQLLVGLLRELQVMVERPHTPLQRLDLVLLRRDRLPGPLAIGDSQRQQTATGRKVRIVQNFVTWSST